MKACFQSVPLVMNHWVVHCKEWIQSSVPISLPAQDQAKERQRGGGRGLRGLVGATNKGWFRIAVRVSFIPRPLSYAWSRLSCYLPVLLDAWSRMRRFVPVLLLETKPLPLTGTHMHTHTSLSVCLFYQLCPLQSTLWFDLSPLSWTPRAWHVYICFSIYMLLNTSFDFHHPSVCFSLTIFFFLHAGLKGSFCSDFPCVHFIEVGCEYVCVLNSGCLYFSDSYTSCAAIKSVRVCALCRILFVYIYIVIVAFCVCIQHWLVVWVMC